MPRHKSHKPPVKVEYLGWEGQGRNKMEAKKAAMARIEKAAGNNSDYQPTLYHWRGYSALVYRTLDGWNVAYLDGKRIKVMAQVLYGTCGYATEREAQVSARLSLAQNGWDGREWTAEILATDEEKREFVGWVAFQKAYRHATSELELDGHEAHQWACENEHRWRDEMIDLAGDATGVAGGQQQ